MKYYTLLLLFFCNYTFITAQNFPIDSTFGSDGIASSVDGVKFNGTSSISIQPDGKFVVSGYAQGDTTKYDFAITRFTQNGQIDNNFADAGISILDVAGVGESDLPYSSILQDDGKIVAVGRSFGPNKSDITLVRYLTDGQIDTNFGDNGRVIFDYQDYYDRGYNIALQADQKLVITGYVATDSIHFLVVMRFNPNGTIDSTFADNGLYLNNFGDINARGYAIEVLNNQKIVTVGRTLTGMDKDIFILQLNADGSLNTDFGDNGIRIIDIKNESNDVAYNLLVQNDGTFLLSGNAIIPPGKKAVIVKILADGTIDQSFGDNGKIINNFAGTQNINSIINQPDGKLLVNASSVTTNTLVRYFPNGQPDLLFGIDGVVTIPMKDNLVGKSMVIQPDGKVVVAGKLDGNKLGIIRFITDFTVGIVDFSLVKNTLVYPNPILSKTTFEYTLQKPESLSLKLFDLSGKCIQTFFSNEKRNQGINQEQLRIDLSIPAGSYLLRLSNGEGIVTMEIIKG